MSQAQKRHRLWFLAAEGLLYLSFLSLDLFFPQLGWNMPLKYLSIGLCFVYILPTICGPEGPLMGVALGLTLLADLFLLVLNRWYLCGVACFCVVQLLYLVRLVRHNRSHLVLRLILRGAVTGTALTVPYLLGVWEPLTALSLFCFSQLVCNALDSLTCLPALRLFSLGLFCFLGCDLCVGLQNFTTWFPHVPALWTSFTRVGMWLFYLPSQVLICLSVQRK